MYVKDMLRKESMQEICCIAETEEIINTVSQRINEYKSTLPAAIANSLEDSELVVLLLYKLCTKTESSVKPLTHKTRGVFCLEQIPSITKEEQLRSFKSVYNFTGKKITYEQMIFMSAVIKRVANVMEGNTPEIQQSINFSKQLDLLESIGMPPDSPLFEFLSYFLFESKFVDVINYGFAELESYCSGLGNTVSDVLNNYSFTHLLNRYFQVVGKVYKFDIIPRNLLYRWLRTNVNLWKHSIIDELDKTFVCGAHAAAYSLAVENGKKLNLHKPVTSDTYLVSSLYEASGSYTPSGTYDDLCLAFCAVEQFYLKMNCTMSDIMVEVPAHDVLLYYAYWMLKVNERC